MASPEGGAIIEALYKLGFEESAERLPPGGGAKLNVTEKTAETIKGLVGKSIRVGDDGKVHLH